MSHLGFLAPLLLTECDGRARRRCERRIKAAQFPRPKSLRQFDFEANPNVDPAVIHTLATWSSRWAPRPPRRASESATPRPPSW
ncbi:hypothetical protein GCM10009678_44430 [Actinomadura kijaniata]|uniref:ATP-binding protein n=1 Tax=Actinomadura kijaniata TaxID=46161 RepID=UPI002FEB2603